MGEPGFSLRAEDSASGPPYTLFAAVSCAFPVHPEVVSILGQLPADPVPILRQLIRFDTSNPPGNEGPCIAYVNELLDAVGIATRVLAADPARPNLVARVPGRGLAPPLLLHAHVDVVPTDGQPWSQPPFEGRLQGGHLWGRGAIDMKGGLAMMLAAILRLCAEGAAPAGDVILAVVADEEAGSKVGAGFLAARHPKLFEGARYAVGEDGGAGLGLRDELRFHPIVVAEKRACWLRATLRGPGGHASRATVADTAVQKLTRLLTGLGDGLLGPHLTAPVDRMLEELARVVSEPLATHLAKLRADPEDGAPLAELPARDAQYLRSVLHHTVNPTVIRGGSRTNVIPSEASVELDGRVLPGDFSTDAFIAELRTRIGDDAELEILVEGEPMPAPTLDAFYELLADLLRELDPGGVPLPMVTTASTDARLFANLGMRCYGWLPLRLPPGTGYRDLLHSADERVPVDALGLGSDCLYHLLQRYR
jgi:acetylornithine deacetylase/succinyl-diaminopimelate desuccinylase-like protein